MFELLFELLLELLFALLFDAPFEPLAAALDAAPELASEGADALLLSPASALDSASFSLTNQPEPLSWKPAAVTCLA